MKRRGRTGNNKDFRHTKKRKKVSYDEKTDEHEDHLIIYFHMDPQTHKKKLIRVNQMFKLLQKVMGIQVFSRQ